VVGSVRDFPSANTTWSDCPGGRAARALVVSSTQRMCSPAVSKRAALRAAPSVLPPSANWTLSGSAPPWANSLVAARTSFDEKYQTVARLSRAA